MAAKEIQSLVFKKLFVLIPEKFNIDNRESAHIAQRGLTMNSKKPQFKINPVIEGSWLDPPKEQDSDIGNWPEHTVFPKGTTPYPKDFPSSLRPPSRPTDFYVEDPNLRRLLMGPKIKEAKLNPSVFKDPTPIKLSGTAFVNSDFFARKALLDAFYSDQLLNCALEIIPKFKANLDEVLDETDTKVDDFLDLFKKLLSMVSFSNQRAYHGLIAAIVANKFGMRNYILNKFETNTHTSDFLRRSNYTTDDVFGEFPRWYLERFIHVNGASLMIKPKPVAKPNSNTKYNTNQGKRKTLTPQSQIPSNQKDNSNDASVFHQAKQYNKGGGRPYGRSRGRGRGS